MSTARVHPTALVDPGADLDEDVEIGPYSIIGPHVRLGRGTRVGAHTVIEGRTTIGAENQIFHHASIGAVPQDLKYRGEASELHIGDRNIVREFTTIHPGTAGGGGSSTAPRR
ncbi:MAG: acyl-[acyl-carrier-protein]--UDP-N-acetylglucosamine O-acyltransferase, partial [Deltaproteobacteria bacterium]|nr:acyl-[acyl-carrier-protein]--UDP-N-acetylglucosamine O-acyltransferase [Deltaproteobacteria bacterium]